MIRTTSGVTTETGPPDSNLDFSRVSEVFNRNFLKHAIDKLVLADLCEKFDLPRHAGTSTMRFFRRAEANAHNVRALTEGTPLTDYSLTQLEKVEVTLAQYGDLTRISDVRQDTDLIKQLELETARMGEEAALFLDTEIRDAMWTGISGQATTAEAAATGGHKAYVINKIGAGGTTVKVQDLDRAATLLTERRAPTFDGGHYVAVVSPRVAYQLRTDNLWLDVGKYSDKEKIYSGEIGKVFNVKVIVHTNPLESSDANIDWNFDGDVLDTVDTVAETAHGLGTIERSFVFGREFAGTVKLAGAGSPMSPRLVMNNKPDKTDPLNQYTMVGWKAYSASLCLNPKFGVAIQSPKASVDVY